MIAAEGEHKASRALKEAAEVIVDSPAALQLRWAAGGSSAEWINNNNNNRLYFRNDNIQNKSDKTKDMKVVGWLCCPVEWKFSYS